MPIEKRDSHSKAKLFIPTNREKSLVESQRLLAKGLEEVEGMKAELQKMMDSLKNK